MREGRCVGALLFCALSVPAILKTAGIHPAIVLLTAAGSIIVWLYLQRGPGISERPASARFLYAIGALFALLCLMAAGGFSAEAFPMTQKEAAMNLILLAIAVYAARDGIEKILRISAVCFLFLLVLYAVLAGFSLQNIESVLPIGRPTLSERSLPVCWLLLPNLLFWCDGLHIKRRSGLWAGILLMVMAGPALLVYLTQTPKLAASEAFPFYRMVESVQVFGVIQRMEALCSAALTAGNFCLMALLAHVCLFLGGGLLPRCKPRQLALGVYALSAAGLLAQEQIMRIAELAAPLVLLLIPLLLRLADKLRRAGPLVTGGQ